MDWRSSDFSIVRRHYWTVVLVILAPVLAIRKDTVVNVFTCTCCPSRRVAFVG